MAYLCWLHAFLVCCVFVFVSSSFAMAQTGNVYAYFPASSPPVLVNSRAIQQATRLCYFAPDDSPYSAISTKLSLSDPSARLIQTVRSSSSRGPPYGTFTVVNQQQLLINKTAGWSLDVQTILSLENNHSNPVTFSQVYCSLFGAELLSSSPGYHTFYPRIESSFQQVIGPGEYRVEVARWMSDFNNAGQSCANVWTLDMSALFDATLQVGQNFLTVRTSSGGGSEALFPCLTIPNGNRDEPCRLFVSNPSLGNSMTITALQLFTQLAPTANDNGFWTKNAIIGVVIGSVALVVILICVDVSCRKRRTARMNAHSDNAGSLISTESPYYAVNAA